MEFFAVMHEQQQSTWKRTPILLKKKASFELLEVCRQAFEFWYVVDR